MAGEPRQINYSLPFDNAFHIILAADSGIHISLNHIRVSSGQFSATVSLRFYNADTGGYLPLLNDYQIEPTSAIDLYALALEPGDRLEAKTNINDISLFVQYDTTISSPNELETAIANAYPISHTQWHEDSLVVTGNGMGVNNDNSRWGQTWWQQFPAALNDSFKFDAALRSGTYNLRLHGMGFNDLGILALDINGVRAFDDLDMFGGAGINAFYDRAIILPYSGVHTFLLTVIDKNANSTGYGAPFTKYHLRRTEDYIED